MPCRIQDKIIPLKTKERFLFLGNIPIWIPRVEVDLTIHLTAGKCPMHKAFYFCR